MLARSKRPYNQGMYDSGCTIYFIPILVMLLLILLGEVRKRQKEAKMAHGRKKAANPILYPKPMPLWIRTMI